MDYRSVITEIDKHDRQWRAESRERDRRRMSSVTRRIPRIAGIAFGVLLLLYLALAFPVSWYQTRLIYWNDVPPMADALTEGWEIRNYVSHDGRTQFASYLHRGDPDKPTVVYLHGRGEHHGIFRHNVTPYESSGWTVVVPEYPGFAGLAGEPSEKAIGALMRKVHGDLVDAGIDPADIVIHGNSLGAGPAMQLAQMPHGLLVLTAPVASMDRMMTHFAAFYPSFLLRDSWDNLGRAKTRHPAPAIVVHSKDDLVVPVDQGGDMAASLEARYIQMEDYGHAVGRLGAGIAKNEMTDRKDNDIAQASTGSRGRI